MLEEKLKKLENGDDSALDPEDDSEGRFSVEINLWVVLGFLDHNLSLHRLERVASTYKRIKVVPKGYN